MKTKLIEQGHSVAIPAGRLVVCVRDNGDNISTKEYYGSMVQKFKQNIKMRLRARLLTGEFRQNFGV